MAYRKRNNLLSSILSSEEVNSMVIMHREGVTQQQIAKQFEVHRNTVRNIINRAKESGLYYVSNRD